MPHNLCDISDQINNLLLQWLVPVVPTPPRNLFMPLGAARCRCRGMQRCSVSAVSLFKVERESTAACSLQDDLFGTKFKICDSNFDRENQIYTVTVPGEFALELYCPQCNKAPPPPAPEATVVTTEAQGANSTAKTDELSKLLPKGECAFTSLCLP
jgi:hypothetical protein